MKVDKLKLLHTFKGKLIFPGEPEFDAARTVFYGGIDRKPAVIIRVKDTHDIAHAIQLAKTTGLELAVRSGGHSLAGYSATEGGIVLDLKDMQKLDINAEEKTAWAETGLTALEVAGEADKYNLVLGFGDTGSVGIGGITLGGGVGFLVRKYGLTIDNLLAAELVTADGSLLYTDAGHRPELFWAIRGGGGNFGVAARFKYRLNSLAQVLGGILLLPATAESITGFVALAEQAPDELSAIANIMPAPPLPFLPAEHHGKLSIMALMMYAGEPGAGEKVLAPFRSLGKPLADLLRPMRYKDIFFPEDAAYHPLIATKTMFMKSVDPKSAGIICERLNESDAPMRVVQLRVLGGAMSRVPADATAFAHRQGHIIGTVAAFYTNEEEKKKHFAWVEKLAKELYQGDEGVYISFLGNEDEVQVRHAYPGATWHKLKEIKKLYDPTNLFRLNHNIPPDR